MVRMCVLEQCSNLHHVQTLYLAFCYNKGEVITEDIPITQDKGHVGI
jgi:hypothetical protein